MKTKTDSETLKLFGVMVVKSEDKSELNLSNVESGFITDFVPTFRQLHLMKEYCQPLPLRTFFTVEERKNQDVLSLIQKQILHYVEVYGLGMSGEITVPYTNEKIISLRYIKGVTVQELRELVIDLIYQNKPVKDGVSLKLIIDYYNLPYDVNLSYDVNQIKNNELRVILFDNNRGHVFNNGDDAVRWLCYKATDSSMLIKSRKVVEMLGKYESTELVGFLVDHAEKLAEVFNRHKKLIMSVKNKDTSRVINRISKLSKKLHIPLHEPITKRAVTLSLNDPEFNIDMVLEKATVRDKLKYLNLLRYKATQQTIDAFLIRNGKIHIEPFRKVYSQVDVMRVEERVLKSLGDDLAPLKGMKILMDSNVDYGLPVSRKQSLGHLPYGTIVKTNSNEAISCGIFWSNDGGANDLDLSTIDKDGGRTGWGQMSGYDSKDVIFSGDITNAPKGAMEFMTSTESSYGLFVNIFSGKIGSKASVVVGNINYEDSKWIKYPIIQEEFILDSKNCVLGFVKGTSLTIYGGQIGGSRASFGGDLSKNAAMAARGMYDFWTLKDLLDILDVSFEVDSLYKDDAKQYDYDLRYQGISFDKLESLMLI